MMQGFELYFYIAAGVAGFFLLLTIVFMVFDVKHKARLSEKESQLLAQEQKITSLETENIGLIRDNAGLKSNLAQLSNNKEELTLKFKEISNETIKFQSLRFDEELLKPFKEQMNEFKAKIEQNKGSFDEQFKNMLEKSTNLSKAAQDLTDALKGGKKLQGNWGEKLLESVLDISGLKNGINYETQKSFTGDNDKRYILDAIVHLPNNRNVVVDSKVSLNDYLKYSQSDDEDSKTGHLKAHIACIKGHIDELSAKEYHKLMKSDGLDFVVMFVPVESAYIDAVGFDNSLYDYAFKKQIMIATPSSLLPILRTVENLWRIENQNKNADKIAELGGYLYDRVYNFMEEMQGIDKALDSAKNKYKGAYEKLVTSNQSVVSTAKRLKDYGAKTSKNLAIESDEILQIEETV